MPDSSESHTVRRLAAAEGGSAPQPSLPPLPRARGVRWRTVAPLAIVLAAAVAVVVGHGWRFEDLWRAFAVFSLGAILVACGAIALQLLLHSGRLWAVASGVTHARWPQTLRAYAYGQVVNTYLPARMGDVVKASMLSRAAGNAPGRMARAAGAVFIADKTIDFVAVALIVLVSLALSPARVIAAPALHIRPAFVLAAAGVTALVAFGLALRPAWRASLHALGVGVIQGTSALVNPGRALAGISLSVAARCIEGATLFVLCQSAGHALRFEQCLWVVVLLNIGTALPLAPANIGTFEASVTLAMTSMGVPTLGALALATVDHALQLVVTFALGAGLWLLGRREQARAAHAAAGVSGAAPAPVPVERADPRAAGGA